MPEPLYASERVVLYCADARDVLAGLASESADAVVMDPPYGKAWRSNTRAERFDRIEGDGAGEAAALLASVTADLVRVVRRTRHVYSFGLPLSHPLLAAKAEIIWDKGRIGSGDLSCPWGPSHEVVNFYARAADKANVARNSGALAARLRHGSIVAVRRLNATQVSHHPTQKPVALMRQLIESSTCVGETVLDPFAGVGSTLVAAILEGRRAIGVEIDRAYVEIAVGRVQAAEKLAAEMDSM